MNISKKELLNITKTNDTPVYVYDLSSLKRAYNRLNSAFKNSEKTEIFYAIKANANKKILKVLLSLGAGLECVSLEEVKLGLSLGFKPKKILITSTAISESEMKFYIKNKIIINIDSFSQLERYGRLNPGGKISIRINGDIGAGHHEHVVTGGINSKFGIHSSQLEEVRKIATELNLKIIGLHQHIGSNIFDEDIFIEAAELLMAEALKFENLEFLDFGGGFGIPYESRENVLDVKSLGRKMAKVFKVFKKEYGKELKMILEPGRYLIAHAGVLLVQIIDIKSNPYKKFVCVNSGFNHLLRPAMYGSYHEVVNLSKPNTKKETVTVVGNVCESGDIFANNRDLGNPEEGDILAIYDAGAYGYVMASEYHLRKKPLEIVVNKNRPTP